jgi:hypothetical protein
MAFAAKEDKEKLRIQFRKSIRHGYTKNAELDPVVSAPMLDTLEPKETCVVRVDSIQGRKRYWFTDRRVLCQHDRGMDELLRYQSVIKAHWMFRDLFTHRLPQLMTVGNNGSHLKTEHFDRLEIELQDGSTVVLDGLDQAIHPALHFFWWIIRSR